MASQPLQLFKFQLVFVVVFASFGYAGSNVHDFGGACETCHLSHPQEGAPGIFVADIDALCCRCHEMVRHNSHPSGIIPSVGVDSTFPLDIEGRMGCTTCHNPCLEQDAQNPHLLRAEFDGVDFCLRCHASGEAVEGRHVMASGFVHSKPWTPAGDGSGDQFDGITIGCMSCHGTALAPSADVTPYQSVASLDPIHGSHPVGMDYARLSASNELLRSLDALAPAISLYEGKVGCASCHSPYSAEKSHLVIDNRDSKLCRECHLL